MPKPKWKWRPPFGENSDQIKLGELAPLNAYFGANHPVIDELKSLAETIRALNDLGNSAPDPAQIKSALKKVRGDLYQFLDTFTNLDFSSRTLVLDKWTSKWKKEVDDEAGIEWIENPDIVENLGVLGQSLDEIISGFSTKGGARKKEMSRKLVRECVSLFRKYKIPIKNYDGGKLVKTIDCLRKVALLETFNIRRLISENIRSESRSKSSRQRSKL